MATDAYSFNWNAALNQAMMFRVSEKQPGPDTICIDREVFDQLVAVAQAAVHANVPVHGDIELRGSSGPNGGVSVTYGQPAIGVGTGSGSALLEAITEAKRDYDRLVEDRIR